MPSTIFVTTGPESSGKTTLAQDLAGALEAPLVTEMSRPYLAQRGEGAGGSRYQFSDLRRIAELQYGTEQAVLAEEPPYLVCDTDLLVILIWSEVRFGRCDPWIRDTLLAQQARHPRHYLLCDCDIPWEPDPLRENPHDRDQLFRLYCDKLDDLGLSYSLIAGTPASRLRQALAFTGL